MKPQGALEKICLTCGLEFTGDVVLCPDDGTELFLRADDPVVGTMLGDKYRLLPAIGHGGMGIVYKAHDTIVDRVVAIKILHVQHVSNEVNVKRFRCEDKTASRLSHPYVIKTYDCDVSQTGQPYIVMDFLEGESLQDLIEKEDHVAVERALKILIQACEALNHAHKQGLFIEM